MKLLKEICNDPHIKCDSYKVRKAARAIVINTKNEIAILNVTNHTYYKIAGGGIEFGEDIEKALRREVMEEVGAEIEILDELGLIIEWKNSHQTQQISYCFVAKTKGEIGKPQFTEKELQDGFAIEWHSLEKAIKLLENSSPQGNENVEYTGKYMVERDLTFLLEYKTKM